MAADEPQIDMIPSIQYSLAVIRDEARRLVQQGIISRQQPIYTWRRRELDSPVYL